VGEDLPGFREIQEVKDFYTGITIEGEEFAKVLRRGDDLSDRIDPLYSRVWDRGTILR
jgi:hypothetical protein